MTAGNVKSDRAAGAKSEWEVIQRVVFPPEADRHTLALYVDPENSSGVVSWHRNAVTLQPGVTTSFLSYFAALPAAYWRAHTTVESVQLSLHLSHMATVTVWRSDAEGISRPVRAPLEAEGKVVIEVDLAADTDGGWLWFDVHPSGASTIMTDASWSARTPARRSRATVCVTTMDRPSDVAKLLRALGEDRAVGERLDAIVVIDQGTSPVTAHPILESVTSLSLPLRTIRQPNLGGSGGFSRGMIEALREGSDHVLLLDDDVVLETESIFRALAFADHSRESIIVGSQMLSLVDRSLLHSVGECVDRKSFWWGPVTPSLAPVDLGVRTLRSTPGLHRRVEVDFNGWWMCMIPTSLLRQAGLSLPLFIKWDDAEFGLRAAQHSVKTVTLPGAALWHMPWTAKDDGLDWQAYFQLRNRVVTALMHSPYRHGGRLAVSALAQDLNHVLCMQYGSVAVRNAAIRDVLSGPEHLWAQLATARGRAQAILEAENQTVVASPDLPPATRLGPDLDIARPQNAVSAAARFARVIAHQLRSPRGESLPASKIPRAEGKWWLLGLLDGGAVESATGKGSFVAQRDRQRAWRLTREAVSLRVRLLWSWPALARRYQAAAGTLSSAEAWQKRIDADLVP